MKKVSWWLLVPLIVAVAMICVNEGMAIPIEMTMDAIQKVSITRDEIATQNEATSYNTSIFEALVVAQYVADADNEGYLPENQQNQGANIDNEAATVMYEVYVLKLPIDANDALTSSSWNYAAETTEAMTETGVSKGQAPITIIAFRIIHETPSTIVLRA
ncbi:MAG: hypothetical protein V1853_01730 [bacterium]